jgi:hypothetical protein
MTTDRSPRRLTKLVAVSAALLATVCVCACGSSTRSLDSAKVERAIAGSILKEHDLHATVACPSKVRQKSGHVFTCTARLDVGAYPVTVTEVDGSGRVRYANERPLVVLDVAKVQQAIEASVYSQRRLRATAACPPEVWAARARGERRSRRSVNRRRGARRATPPNRAAPASAGSRG